jgi:hypothetical protein
MTALAGPTGSGKTTIAALTGRFFIEYEIRRRTVFVTPPNEDTSKANYAPPVRNCDRVRPVSGAELCHNALHVNFNRFL